MRKSYVYVVVDLERLGKTSDTPKTYGSMKELVSADIQDKGATLTYAALVNRLSRDSEIHYWKSDRYVIKKCEVLRSKQQNKKS